MADVSEFLSGKIILVLGACGTIGKELSHQLATNYDFAELICLDNNESDLFFLEQYLGNIRKIQCYLGDVRDYNKLNSIMKDVDVVFHTAAFKHVVLCERSPFEAVRTNIMGVQNVIRAAMANDVGKVIFTSSDKAVNPTSVMGTSKLMGERLISAANNNSRAGGTKLCSTRFGNVLGSRGSVIPIFKQQIKKGGPVTLTSDKMTRFIMSIEEAVKLVINTAAITMGGEVFITKMPTIKISTLAEVMINELAGRYGYEPADIEITTIGAKPGEKYYEELMNSEEIRRSLELEKYFVVLPAYLSPYRLTQYQYEGIVKDRVEVAYNTANERPLTKQELLEFLHEQNLLEEREGIDGSSSRWWPDIN